MSRFLAVFGWATLSSKVDETNNSHAYMLIATTNKACSWFAWKDSFIRLTSMPVNLFISLFRTACLTLTGILTAGYLCLKTNLTITGADLPLIMLVIFETRDL